jgi:NSS family neurotransmitter:Na+ symporter
MNYEEEKRDSFSSKYGFILACIGSAVGMGNIWLFPTRVSAYGGGSFLIPYFLFVIILGFSGTIGEMAFGRASRKGPMGAFRYACEETNRNGNIGEAIGFIPVIGSYAMAIGYTVVVGWIIKYVFKAFSGYLISNPNIETLGGLFGSTASAGGNNFFQIIAVVIVTVIVVFGIGNGIEKANKIMMPLFFFMFVCLAIYINFQPGAKEGYKYMFTIDPVMIRNPLTWVYALGQAFFSLSLAGNGTLIYGTYLSDKEDVLDSAWKVALFDTIAAMLAALVIIPAMATTGSKLSQGGPGLMFIHIPHLFSTIPGGAVLMILFFVAVLFGGISSLINLYESPIATMQEKFHLSRRMSSIIILAIGLGISLGIQDIVSPWMDFVTIYACPLGAGLAAIMFYVILGKEKSMVELQKGREKTIGGWVEILAKFVFIPISLIVFILGIILGGIG